MGRLSTHVLDTARGRPAADVAIELYGAHADQWTLLARTRTNADGRTDAPLLTGASFKPGRYRLCFAMGDYFRAAGMDLPDPAFVDRVTLEFGLAEADGHYHVPLLASPWSWSTYRGS